MECSKAGLLLLLHSGQLIHQFLWTKGNDTSNSGAGNSWQGAVQNGLVLGLSSATPLVRGGVFQLDFRSRPGLPVIAHGAFKLDAPATIGFAAQPEWGFATNSVQIALLIADSQGRANAAITVPNSPLLQDLPLWFCGWTEQGLPVQLSPVLGGLIR